jgi:alpha-1,2-mannosyltransferase
MLLPVPLAGLLWDLLALVALGIALALIAGELQLRPRPWQAAALLTFVAVWPPLLNTLLNAQVSPLLLLLYALAWRWARRGQSAAAGAALGIATALRLFPGLLVLYFALRRDWRLVGAALATFAASSLVLLPVIGPGAYWDYIARETPAATADWIASQHNTSLAGLAYHLLGADASAATLLGRLLTVSLLLALVALTWMRRHVGFVRDEATFLAYVPAALLATPILWQHYFVVLLLPLALLGARLGMLGAPTASPVAARRLRCVAGLALASLALIEIGYVLQMFAFPRPLAALASAGVDGPPTYALLAILIALLLLPAAASARYRPRSGPVPQVAGIRYNL